MHLRGSNASDRCRRPEAGSVVLVSDGCRFPDGAARARALAGPAPPGRTARACDRVHTMSAHQARQHSSRQQPRHWAGKPQW
jgi:hypothetical protein